MGFIDNAKKRLKSELNWIHDRVKDGTAYLVAGAAYAGSYALTESGSDALKPMHDWLVDGPVNKIMTGTYWLDGPPGESIDVPNVSPYLAILGLAYGCGKISARRHQSNVEAYKKAESSIVSEIIAELEADDIKDIDSLDAGKIYSNVLEKLRAGVKSRRPLFKTVEQKACEAFEKDKGSYTKKGSYLHTIERIKRISDPGKRKELMDDFVDPSQIERLEMYLKNHEEKRMLSNHAIELKKTNLEIAAQLQERTSAYDKLAKELSPVKDEQKKHTSVNSGTPNSVEEPTVNGPPKSSVPANSESKTGVYSVFSGIPAISGTVEPNTHQQNEHMGYKEYYGTYMRN